MRFTSYSAVAATLFGAVLAGSSTSKTSSAAPAATTSAAPEPGYFTNFSTVSGPAADNLTFGSHYAVLQLDMINAIVSNVNTTANGKAWIQSTARWNDAVHAKKPAQPLTIFSRIYFYKGHPEVSPATPFYKVASPGLIDFVETSPGSFVYPAFKTVDTDIQLQKVRYYAGAFNELETILKVQKIDTVVISGIRTAGVILDTIYRLFDLDYNIFLIINNSIEPSANGALIDQAVKQGIVPKLPAQVITLDQALAALARSGP